MTSTPHAISSSSSDTIDVPTIFIFDTSLSRNRYLEIIGSLPTPGQGNANANANARASGSGTGGAVGDGIVNGRPSSPAGAKGELGEIVKRIMRGRGGGAVGAPPTAVGGSKGYGKGKGKEADAGIGGGRQPRFSIIITSSTSQSSSASHPSSSSSSPIIHSQYFLPLTDFWPALPGLSGLFPNLPSLSPTGMRNEVSVGGVERKDGSGRAGESIPQTQTTPGGASGPGDDPGLLEGLIAGLETFDLQARNPFSASSISSTSANGLSPFFHSAKASRRERERYLVVFSGRDPGLLLEEKEKVGWVRNDAGGEGQVQDQGQKEEAIQGQTRPRSLTVENNLTNTNTGKGAKSNSTALTGLISPSPSPEDRAQLLSTLSPNRPSSDTAISAMQKRSQYALRRRVRSNWDKGLDEVTWDGLVDELEKRDVVVGAVLSGCGNGDGMVAVGAAHGSGTEEETSQSAFGGARWIGCLTGLMNRIQDRSSGSDDAAGNSPASRCMESPWWTLVPGSRALLPNWKDGSAGSTAVVPALKTVTSTLQDDKNANGKRPYAAASPLEQDLETEAKRFKAERDIATAQQHQAMANAMAHKLTPSPAMQANMSNLTAAQMAVVNDAIVKQAQMEQIAAEQNRTNGQGMGTQATSAVSAAYTDISSKLYGAHPSTIGNTSAPPLPPPGGATAGGRQLAPIWKGRILTSPPKNDQNGVMQQPDISTMPIVTAFAVNSTGSIAEYAPQQWPQQFLTVRQACRRDMQALQNCHGQQQCVFVEFRPESGPVGGPQPNHQAFLNLANKLVGAEVMLVCTFGALEGGGLILTPHRAKNDHPWKLLGACFFKTPIPQQILQARARPPAPPTTMAKKQNMSQQQQQVQQQQSGHGGPRTQSNMAGQPSTITQVPAAQPDTSELTARLLKNPKVLHHILNLLGHDPSTMKNLDPLVMHQVMIQVTNWVRANPQVLMQT